MPRILNYIKGEGTVKLQRWGLQGLGTESVDSVVTFGGGASHYCKDALAAQAGGCIPGIFGTDVPFYDPNTGAINPGGGGLEYYPGRDPSLTPLVYSGRTIGEWIGSNLTLVVVAAVGTLLLLRRR